MTEGRHLLILPRGEKLTSISSVVARQAWRPLLFVERRSEQGRLISVSPGQKTRGERRPPGKEASGKREGRLFPKLPGEGGIPSPAAEKGL